MALSNTAIYPVIVRDFAGVLLAFVQYPVPGFYRTNPWAPDRTKNIFYRFFNRQLHKINNYAQAFWQQEDRR